MDRPPPEIVRHYETIEQGRRITEGLGRLELLRTQEVLGRYLPAPPRSILDVGGATGVHAEWLASLGHKVHIVDPMPHHVGAASQLVRKPGQITAEVGDARNLPVDDAVFDAVLLFGPLYHLTERDDRLRAWTEAQRVVRPGGFIFAAAISRFASLFDGLARGYLFDPALGNFVERDLREGQHRNPTDRPHWFTTAYFHHPDELQEEAEAAGAAVVKLVGVEGLAGWLPQLAETWSSPEGREVILQSARFRRVGTVLAWPERPSHRRDEKRPLELRGSTTVCPYPCRTTLSQMTASGSPCAPLAGPGRRQGAEPLWCHRSGQGRPHQRRQRPRYRPGSARADEQADEQQEQMIAGPGTPSPV